MPLWDTTSNKPKNLTTAEKRNVIATDVGWVRRTTYTDTHGQERTKDEILVPINDLANSSFMGVADISGLAFVSSTAVANTEVSVLVSFNEPVFHSGLAGNLKFTVANTAGGASGLTGVHVANSSSITGADNTLTFVFTPTVAGTYKIEAQTIANATATAANVVALTADGETASLVISGTVSNSAGVLTVTAE